MTAWSDKDETGSGGSLVSEVTRAQVSRAAKAGEGTSVFTFYRHIHFFNIIITDFDLLFNL